MRHRISKNSKSNWPQFFHDEFFHNLRCWKIKMMRISGDLSLFSCCWFFIGLKKLQHESLIKKRRKKEIKTEIQKHLKSGLQYVLLMKRPETIHIYKSNCYIASSSLTSCFTSVYKLFFWWSFVSLLVAFKCMSRNKKKNPCRACAKQ